MIRYLALLVCVFGLLCSVGCSEPTCWLEAVNVTYTYNTSCSDVATTRRGTLTFQAPLAQTSLKARQMELTTQAQNAGLAVDEVVLVWSQAECPSPANTSDNPLTIQNYRRIVLAPNGSTSTVQRLLACEPIGSKPPGTLNTNFLFACHTGQSSSAACTFELEVKR